MTLNDLQQLLFQYRDTAYADFSAGLIPTVPREKIIGIRSPEYKKIIRQIGDEWIVFAALKQTKKGYDNFLVITADTQPAFAAGTQQRMYGTCIGTYQVQSEEDLETYPSFDLLFWDQL